MSLEDGTTELDSGFYPESALKARMKECYRISKENGRWAEVYECRGQWVESWIGSGHTDENGNTWCDEEDYEVWCDGHLEDYAADDIYENGWYKDGSYDSPYAYMLAGKEVEISNMHQYMIEYCEKNDKPIPQWCYDDGYYE